MCMHNVNTNVWYRLNRRSRLQHRPAALSHETALGFRRHPSGVVVGNRQRFDRSGLGRKNFVATPTGGKGSGHDIQAYRGEDEPLTLSTWRFDHNGFLSLSISSMR